MLKLWGWKFCNLNDIFQFIYYFLLLKMLFLVLNEIFNGVVHRNYGKEQSFFSNTGAALLTMAAHFGFKSFINYL